MALKAAAIVKDAGQFDHAIFAATIEKEMPGLFRQDRLLCFG